MSEIPTLKSFIKGVGYPYPFICQIGENFQVRLEEVLNPKNCNSKIQKPKIPRSYWARSATIGGYSRNYMKNKHK